MSYGREDACSLDGQSNFQFQEEEKKQIFVRAKFVSLQSRVSRSDSPPNEAGQMQGTTVLFHPPHRKKRVFVKE